MKILKHLLLLLVAGGISLYSYAQDPPVNFRSQCDPPTAQTELSANNVRARLLTGGDLWWDGDNGQYIVPKNEPGEPRVSAIYAAGTWIGGVDDAGNLKLAAQTYGRPNNFNFWPGPLLAETGNATRELCNQWDRFFKVTSEDINTHLENWYKAVSSGQAYKREDVPANIKGWPARGNDLFFDYYQFHYPESSQGLAPFYDQDGDGDYNPLKGDFPVRETRGCFTIDYGDEMIFWVYNDAGDGNIHAISQGDVINMEIQAMAYSYKTNDELNDMTFYQYKLVNRAIESIDSTFFALWVDPELGCYTDDYIGCDPSRDLAYIYNEDARDGTFGCECFQGLPTYCEEIPILGIDLLRGPQDEFGNELGMSSFTYYIGTAIGTDPPIWMAAPNNAQEYYNYMTGTWRNGSPLTYGGDGFQDGEPTNYAFPSAPDDSLGWSLCTEDLPLNDRNFLQSTGPFRMDPGAVQEMTYGVLFVPDQKYPCPSLERLWEVDDKIQNIFDNCLWSGIQQGPDAPDVYWIELDQEVIAILSNDPITSNNANEQFSEFAPGINANSLDTLYKFEGYKLYQLAGPENAPYDFEDPIQARLVYQVDIKNGIGKIFNWNNLTGAEDSPEEVPVFESVLKVDGADEGIQHTFRITTDQFATGDNNRLINHKKYYYVAVAYAYNNYEDFDPDDGSGQDESYIESRRNLGNGFRSYYTVIPRPVRDREINADFGDGAVITRLDGIGNGGNFLDLSDESRQAIEESFVTGELSGELVYRPGRGPVKIFVYNPLEVIDGTFQLTLKDGNLEDNLLEEGAYWELQNLDDPNTPVILSERNIDELNEQVIREFGFSVTVLQKPDVGQDTLGTNGAVGYEEEYDPINATPWIRGIPDELVVGENNLDQSIFDYMATGSDEPDKDFDPTEALSNIGPGYFVPYFLANYRQKPSPYITPAWLNSTSNVVRNGVSLSEVNNVDIVFTSDKELWSRCVVVEMANSYYTNVGFFPEDNEGETTAHFELRGDASVTKFDNDGDGLPDIDPEGGNSMGWFPGYAIDVETGQRLNIFFGENSVYDCQNLEDRGLGALCAAFPNSNTGGDMMFNPTDQLKANFFDPMTILPYIAGGQHFVYVTKQPYDECEFLREKLSLENTATRTPAFREITWAGLIMLQNGQDMKNYQDGLVPADVRVKIRVDNPYQVKEATGVSEGYPTYLFALEGTQAEELDVAGVEAALDLINIFPNPYYGFSDYESDRSSNLVKITNLPASCTVTIFTLDGKVVRHFDREEVPIAVSGSNRGIKFQQIYPDLEWDLNNTQGIPVGSGVYLFHVEAKGLGSRTLKWFGINRKPE